MSRRFMRWTIVPAAAALSLLTGGAASAHEEPAKSASAPVSAARAVAADGATYLVAEMSGANETRTAAAPAGDTDGFAIQIVRIKGNEVRFATAWDKIATPSSAHIHSGIIGVNGPVRIDYFSNNTLPSGVRAVVGRVAVADTALLNSIKADPGAFYANIHNVQFPGGALRGQFREINEVIDLDVVLDTGFLRAHMSGAQEFNADGEANAGDPNGRGWAAVDAQGSRVVYATKWANIGAPTAAHIHIGAAGHNGDVVVPLFASTTALPRTIQGLSGVVRNVDSALLARIRRNPANYYVNVHNAEFPSGAVRGQLSVVPQEHH